MVTLIPSRGRGEAWPGEEGDVGPSDEVVAEDDAEFSVDVDQQGDGGTPCPFRDLKRSIHVLPPPRGVFQCLGTYHLKYLLRNSSS